MAIVLTAMTIGILAVQLRSAAYTVLAGILIVMTFGCAYAFSTGGVDLIDLLVAILVYNGGIMAAVVVSLAIDHFAAA